MKLAAGNPDLKKKAMRVNKLTPIESFAPSLGDKNPRAYVSGEYEPKPHNPNAAQPNSTDLWKQPVYTPKPVTSARPGADDHLNYKSRGM